MRRGGEGNRSLPAPGIFKKEFRPREGNDEKAKQGLYKKEENISLVRLC